ncbi:unnamed protein product [Lymnaea stagnalis]|uniref:Peptidase M12B domain-containing protein n=1 Tax=Lymnaea stagnalis TaxID=6523 RepID=A0AAV2HL27_LYMST
MPVQIIGVSVMVLLLSLSNPLDALTASINYTSHGEMDKLLPDDLNVTLTFNISHVIHLRLTRLQHLQSEVPLYTLSLDHSGHFVHTRQRLIERMNIGYYQDLRRGGAIVQITRTNDQGEKKARLEMKGDITVAGTRYFITPVKKVERKSSQLSQLPVAPGSEDDVVELRKTAPGKIDSIERKISRPSSPDRTSAEQLNSPRDAVTDYYVDVVAVVDYQAYRRFASETGNRTASLYDVQEYYAFVFHGVDVMYQSITATNYRLHVHLIKIIVCETPESSPFTVPYHVTHLPKDEVDGETALNALTAFVEGPGRDSVTPYDHVMLFTGYDITSDDGMAVSTSGIGRANMATTCRTAGNSTSLIEDHGDYACTDTAAHELGHSLSANHDGDYNSCSSLDHYIMAWSLIHDSDATKLNPWKFSICSITYFTNYIQQQVDTPFGKACLETSLRERSVLPDVSNRLLGQEILPDEQCRMAYGEKSEYCRGSEFGKVSDICTTMFCLNPVNTNFCYKYLALHGTTCGSGKVCIGGACVTQVGAPLIDESCVFGDTPGLVSDGLPCEQLVRRNASICHQSWFKDRCCASCKDTNQIVIGR